MYKHNIIKNANQKLLSNPNQYFYLPKCEYCGLEQIDWIQYKQHLQKGCQGRNIYEDMMRAKDEIERQYSFNPAAQNTQMGVQGISDTMGGDHEASALDLLGLGDNDDNNDNNDKDEKNNDDNNNDNDEEMKSPENQRQSPGIIDISEEIIEQEDALLVETLEIQQHINKQIKKRDAKRKAEAERRRGKQEEDAIDLPVSKINPIATFYNDFDLERRLKEFKKNVFDYTPLQGAENQVTQLLFSC